MEIYSKQLRTLPKGEAGIILLPPVSSSAVCEWPVYRQSARALCSEAELRFWKFALLRPLVTLACSKQRSWRINEMSSRALFPFPAFTCDIKIPIHWKSTFHNAAFGTTVWSVFTLVQASVHVLCTLQPPIKMITMIIMTTSYRHFKTGKYFSVLHTKYRIAQKSFNRNNK